MSSQFLTLLLLISIAAIHHLPVVTCRTWCVALPATSAEQLQNNIKFGCSHIDCAAINPGGTCYYPNTLYNHASYVMNAYYQSQGRTFAACTFGNTGFQIGSDPSAGECVFPA
ncbi:unnamed protein product [Microthlaspi erraticum]|uniref:X8 domain-containing protein n=1 Tax=Microthlaspi erraticum TaxID=1685480 RepID=A0A6D2J256_9BRAS|nr:unnamed protein product [Microthlaspi erraticum]